MPVKFLGDSNFRDLFAAHKDEIESETEEKVDFVQTTSVASVKSWLETEANLSITFIACPMNEISLKSKNNTKSREGIVESVIGDLYSQVCNIANKNESSLFVICQPFIRLDPPWMESKMSFIEEFVKSTLNNSTPGNIHLGSIYDILSDDLKSDNVHLNSKGIDKLKTVVISDIKVAKTEYNILKNGTSNEDEEMDEMSTPVNEKNPGNEGRNLRRTPARRKRPLDDTNEDTNGKGRKKKAREGIEAVLDKLDLMMEKMNGEKLTNQVRFDKIEEKLVETVSAQSNLQKEMNDLKESDKSFSASMREDLDAVENQNSRDTIIVKKLSIDVEVPKDKKELSNLIVSTGREIITLLLGSDKGMKFVAPLYFNNNKRIPKEGERKELPPFKITFKLLSDSLEFKEKAIVASKDPQHRLYKAYVSHQQSVGTRIRLSLLWGIADALKKEKKDSWVSQSSPKPCLMVKDTGPLVRTYSYIEAVTTFGTKIETKILDEATKLANRFYFGQVEKVFLILKD
jgi:hypothetical protein